MRFAKDDYARRDPSHTLFWQGHLRPQTAWPWQGPTTPRRCCQAGRYSLSADGTAPTCSRVQNCTNSESPVGRTHRVAPASAPVRKPPDCSHVLTSPAWTPWSIRLPRPCWPAPPCRGIASLRTGPSDLGPGGPARGIRTWTWLCSASRRRLALNARESWTLWAARSASNTTSAQVGRHHHRPFAD